jgi:hypothetical protein
LECDVADLQEKILSEIKKRASLIGQAAQKEDKTLASILEAAKSAPPAPTQPWYMNPNLPGREKAS